jgi:hypothetical protein
VPVTPVALSVIDVPVHNGLGDALILVIVGNALTVTDIVDIKLAHVVVGSVTVKLYTPLATVTDAVNDGEAAVEVNPFGPDHAYIGVPVLVTPVALSVIEVPVHNGLGDALILVIVGSAFTVTGDVTEVLLVQPVPG